MTGRLLLPALVRLAGAGQLPAEMHVVAMDRDAGDDDAYRDHAEKLNAHAGPRREGDGGLPGAAVPTGRPTSPPRTPCARRSTVSRHPSRSTSPYRTPVRAHRHGPLAAGLPPHATLVVEKPFGTDLDGARSSTRCSPRSFDERGLPRRPLPGEADRPERARPAFRQPDLRAALERRAHQPGGDRLGRDRWRWRGERPTTTGRRPAGHGAEPPPADARAGRRWTRPSITDRDLRDRKVDVLRRRGSPSPRRWRRRPAAPATPRAPSAGRTCRPTPTPRVSTRRGAPRRSPR